MFSVDTRTETFLTALGVKWWYDDDVRISSLVDDWDKHNIGRSQDRVDDAVVEYATLMHTSAAPAPILRDGSKMDVLDGVQRILAAELNNYKSIQAYVVDTKSQPMVNKVRIMANARLQGGHQESKDWTLQRAVEVLILENELSVEEVAELGGWTAARVREKVRIVDTRMRIRGVGGPEGLPDCLIKHISSASTKDDFAAAPTAIASFLSDVKSMRLPADDCKPFVDDFFRVQRSRGKLHQQLESSLSRFRDDEFVKRRLDPVRSIVPMSHEDKLIRTIRACCTMASDAVRERATIHNVTECNRLINQLRKSLDQLHKMGRGHAKQA